ncbi:MAG: hypothetical protein IT546_13485 [Caulobacteraceae bacterium]|nr:hypothetical protein [Caulobacteraceae bacterium]
METLEALEIAAARNRSDDMLTRYVWTGAAANGAALLATANIVANVASPDTALRALVWPNTLFIVGLSFGAAAISQILYLSILRVNEAIHQSAADAAFRNLQGTKPVVAELPMSLELARIVHGDNADNEIRKLYANVVRSALDSSERSKPEFEEAQAKKEKVATEILRSMRRALWLFQISMMACAIGFLLGTSGFLLGVKLERPDGDAVSSMDGKEPARAAKKAPALATPSRVSVPAPISDGQMAQTVEAAPR